MKGKNFAPIGTVGIGHWILLAKYDEKTDKILKLDSSPARATWVPLDGIVDKCVRCHHMEGNFYELVVEMPIFTRTEEITEVILDFDNFTEQTQEKIIKSIG